jgi:hypothetical protein
MIDNLISDIVTDLAKQSILEQLAPFLLVGSLTAICIFYYHLTERIDRVISRERKKGSNR